MRALALVLLLLVTAGGAAARVSGEGPVNQALILSGRPGATLADYRFFRDARARAPNAGVTPYDLNTALFSDDAVKFRYVYTPPGAQARYNGDGVFEFPVGSVLIKTFAYPADARTPDDNIRFLETRLLIRQRDGWAAYPYVWNADGTEARYTPIGADVPVERVDASGAPVAINWRVPNRNQCAGCHMSGGAIAPIGPAARNLNRDYPYAEGAANQLTHWVARGHLDVAPADAPRAAEAFNAASGSLEARARAYLDVNCAHCHNPAGPAHTSGLDLRSANTDATSLGIFKRPIAAGRASADLAFSIEPGHPERSILVHRMASLDPGVMMPELGRQSVDARGLALIREWIAAMNAAPAAR